jgi:hypothetical protein
MLAEETHYPSEVLDVCVLPDAEVGGTDATLGDYGSRLSEDGACSAYGTSAEVDKMPVVGKAVFAGILAHGRNGNPVTKRNIADLKRIEQVHDLWMVTGCKKVRRSAFNWSGPRI